MKVPLFVTASSAASAALLQQGAISRRRKDSEIKCKQEQGGSPFAKARRPQSKVIVARESM